MTFKEIQELVKVLGEAEISEFKMKDGEFELSVKTKHFQPANMKAPIMATPNYSVHQPSPGFTPPPVAPAQPTPPPAAAPAPHPDLPASSTVSEAGKTLKQIKSPIVGTFYRSSSPDKPPFVKVGDTVEVGTVVCIVEAMKLFNEIESEISGKIVNVLIEDAQPVEYDQVLFEVDPNG